jgi:dienelactone hydrolase
VFLSHLASHGYVVAAPEHQDCRGSCSFSDYSSEIVRRPLDVRSAVDSVLSLDSSNDAILKNMVDPQRVGVAGQSFGGWTALEAQQTDSRFRAALVMNAATVQLPPADPTKVSRPLLMMTGELDALVPFALTEDFYSRVPAAQDRFLLVVPRAGHEFMDQCFDAALTLLTCATALAQDQLVGIMNGIGTAFLDRYVAGEPASASGLLLDATNSPNYTLVPTRASASPQPLPTAAPAPAGPTPSAAGTANQPGTVLLKDDLANAQDGKLPTSSTDPARYSAAYADGSYDIAVHRSFDQGESVLPGRYADATLSVDAVLVHPEDDQYVQLACRSQNATSQYRFGFRPTTGEVWINRWFAEAGIQRYTPLSDDMSRAIRGGSESNCAELTCKGTTIEARINGATVASVSDNTFQAGQFWIAVGESPGGTPAAVKTEAHFSNLAITQE